MLYSLSDIPDAGLPPGVLPIEIRKLVQSRKQVKGLIKDKSISKEQYTQVRYMHTILSYCLFVTIDVSFLIAINFLEFLWVILEKLLTFVLI